MDAEQFAARAKSVRRRIVSAIYHGKKGHIGGALSCADILLYLYAEGIVTPSFPGFPSKHPLILSKGHSATALLAVVDELGLADTELLATYNKDGSVIGNNPCELVPGIEFHTGSLGHGVGLACGVALAHQIQDNPAPVVVLISDGELLEGSTWEALLFAASKKLNICVIIDRNEQICEDRMADAVDVFDLNQMLEGAGFLTMEIDGHWFRDDLKEIGDHVLRVPGPVAFIANTVKGKGVSFMEGVVRWHHSIPTADEYLEAIKELA